MDFPLQNYMESISDVVVGRLGDFFMGAKSTVMQISVVMLTPLLFSDRIQG